MNRTRWLTAAAVILAATFVHGQVALSPDINLFG